MQRGPDDAHDLDTLFVVEQRGLVRLARLLTGSDAASEDLVQDAFLRLHTTTSRPDNDGAFLRTILVNLCRDHLRRRVLEQRAVVATPLPMSDPDIDETWTALGRLPFSQRSVLVLRYYADLPEAEIAQVLGCRLGTVKSRTHRGLAALRKELRS
jgi:RNA polymerase sigma-70 factor (sigma-E family)